MDIKNKLLPFLHEYPLISSKSLDFKDFISVIELINQKKHLTPDGFNIIKSIATAMNRNRSSESRTKYYDSNNFKNSCLTPHYIQGFTDGEGCFYYYLDRNKPIYDYASFEISQKSTEEPLLYKINNYFKGTGTISKRRNQDNIITSSTLKIQNRKSIKEIIIPFFNDYTLITIKIQRYNIWKKLITMYTNKEYKTKLGREKMISLKKTLFNI